MRPGLGEAWGYTASFDLTMGVGVPLLGIAVGSFGYRAAFAAGALAGLASLLVALALASSSLRAGSSSRR